MTEGHKVYSPHTLSLCPSFCLLSLRPLYFKRLSIYTDDNDVGWHNTAAVKLENILGLLGPDGLQWKGGERYQVHPVLTSHNAVQDLRTVWNYFETSQSFFSSPLFAALSCPRLHVCFSPAALSFCHQCLRFEPNSINLSGKLQMFRVNYVNYKGIKLQKVWSPRFILWFITLPHPAQIK